MTRLLDNECLKGKPVQWYLMTSYLYYVHDISIISDGAYDDLCKRLLNGFLGFEDFTHPHSNLIDLSALAAGSGFQIQRNE